MCVVGGGAWRLNGGWGRRESMQVVIGGWCRILRVCVDGWGALNRGGVYGWGALNGGGMYSVVGCCMTCWFPLLRLDTRLPWIT